MNKIILISLVLTSILANQITCASQCAAKTSSAQIKDQQYSAAYESAMQSAPWNQDKDRVFLKIKEYSKHKDLTNETNCFFTALRLLGFISNDTFTITEYNDEACNEINAFSGEFSQFIQKKAGQYEALISHRMFTTSDAKPYFFAVLLGTNKCCVPSHVFLIEKVHTSQKWRIYHAWQSLFTLSEWLTDNGFNIPSSQNIEFMIKNSIPLVSLATCIKAKKSFAKYWGARAVNEQEVLHFISDCFSFCNISEGQRKIYVKTIEL